MSETIWGAGDWRGNLGPHPLITDGHYIKFETPSAPTSVAIIFSGKTLVTIKPDGEIVYGEGYTPDAAAKAFWDALGYERKRRAAC